MLFMFFNIQNKHEEVKKNSLQYSVKKILKNTSFKEQLL